MLNTLKLVCSDILFDLKFWIITSEKNVKCYFVRQTLYNFAVIRKLNDNN